MNCDCGQPVYIRKRGLCKSCYMAWWLIHRNEIKAERQPPKHELVRAQKAADPTWKKKTAIAKAQRLLRKLVRAGVARAHNPLARVHSVEMRAIERVNHDAPYLKLWRQGCTLQEIGTANGTSRERARQILKRWGLSPKMIARPSKAKRRTATAEEKAAREALKTQQALLTFWHKVDRSGGQDACWPWTGPASGPKKYPNIRIPRASDRASMATVGRRGGQAYRVAYVLSKGPIPKGLTVDHLCFNPLCCNPAHLQLLTLGENAARKDPRKKRGGDLYKERGYHSRSPRRVRTHCKRGHEFTPENTYHTKVQRYCKACRQMSRPSKKQQLAEAA